jgi:PhoH-like ATPase
MDGPSKLFVLDTNVLLHDPSCLFRFEEHDVFLPMIVLEELDAHKKGMT